MINRRCPACNQPAEKLPILEMPEQGESPALRVIDQAALKYAMEQAEARDDQIQKLILARLSGIKCALVEEQRWEGDKLTTTFRFEFEEN